jgi:hypothetical protein
MASLGYPLKFADPPEGWAAWKPADDERPLFCLSPLYNGLPHASGNGQMVALPAKSRAAVDECHKVALEMGGRCEVTITEPIFGISMATSSVFVTTIPCLNEGLPRLRGNPSGARTKYEPSPSGTSCGKGRARQADGVGLV